MTKPKFKIQNSISAIHTIASFGLCLLSLMAFSSPIDSLRLETINGKQFIIHQVDPKETLYAISRKYGVPVASLIESNPKADAGLSVGQELKIPYFPKEKTEKGNGLHKVVAHETLFSISRMYKVTIDDLKTWNNLKDNSLDLGQELIVKKKEVVVAKAPYKVPTMKSLRGVHTITAKETLFSISKMYGATVQQLISWNNLTTNELKPGQTIYVLPPMSIPEKPQPNNAPTEKVSPSKITNQEIKISEGVIGTEEIHEKGKAGLMEGTEGNRKYLALHKTVKMGTILKVRSDETNREIFVRVIGSPASDDGSIIKISRSAYDKLGAPDPKFDIELIYYK